jgi:uncharacterized protein (DUF302 family)
MTPMVVTPSANDYVETMRLLAGAVERRGLTVFAAIDHAAGAREAGLELADEAVVVFGSPRSGTPLMQTDPRVGIELPLRLLVWREKDTVLVGYRDPRELTETYEIASHQSTLEQMAALLAALASEATSPSS